MITPGPIGWNQDYSESARPVLKDTIRMPTAFNDISLLAGSYDAVVERYDGLFCVERHITHHDRASLRLFAEAGRAR